MPDDTTSFTRTGHSDYIFALAFSPDSTYLASASRDTTVSIWHMHSHNVEARFIALSSDDDRESLGAINRASTTIVDNNIEEYIVYHEMLHLKHPVKVRGSRRCVHPAEFQAEERLFPRLEDARRFLKLL